MKKHFFLFFILVSIFSTSCYDIQDAAIALSLLNANGDKSTVVASVIENVTKQLFLEGKAESIQLGDNKFIKAKSPLTYRDIQVILEESLKKALGNKWENALNDYLAQNGIPSIELNDMPKDLVAELENVSNTYSADVVTNTGVWSHFFSSVPPSGQWATAKSSPATIIVPIPGGPFYGYWLWGGTRQVFNFQLPQDSPAVDLVTVEIIDGNGNPYVWTDGDILSTTGPTVASIANAKIFNLYSPFSFALFSYPTIYVTSWSIIVYETPTPEVWVQSF